MEWVKTKDRLPNKRCNNLLVLIGESYYFARFIKDGFIYKDYFTIQDESDWYIRHKYVDAGEVDYWCEISNPYE